MTLKSQKKQNQSIEQRGPGERKRARDLPPISPAKNKKLVHYGGQTYCVPAFGCKKPSSEAAESVGESPRRKKRIPPTDFDGSVGPYELQSPKNLT